MLREAFEEHSLHRTQVGQQEMAGGSLEEEQAACDVKMMMTIQTPTRPVSYTHLDVYKRQS